MKVLTSTEVAFNAYLMQAVSNAAAQLTANERNIEVRQDTHAIPENGEYRVTVVHLFSCMTTPEICRTVGVLLEKSTFEGVVEHTAAVLQFVEEEKKGVSTAWDSAIRVPVKIEGMTGLIPYTQWLARYIVEYLNAGTVPETTPAPAPTASKEPHASFPEPAAGG